MGKGKKDGGAQPAAGDVSFAFSSHFHSTMLQKNLTDFAIFISRSKIEFFGNNDIIFNIQVFLENFLSINDVTLLLFVYIFRKNRVVANKQLVTRNRLKQLQKEEIKEVEKKVRDTLKIVPNLIFKFI